MPKANVEDVEIYYEAHGEGVPVLLVSGLGGTGSYWTPQIGPFSDRFRTIVHDHRGTGQSTHDTRIAYSVDQMTRDTIGLMDALEIDKAHLVGHSTGGAIAQIMAVEHPERLLSMVVYASWVTSDPFMRRVMNSRKRLALSGGAKAYAEATPIYLFPDWWINQNAAWVEELDRKTVAGFPPPSIAASRCDAVVAFDRSADLEKIRTPTLVLCARDDFLTPQRYSEDLARRIPQAELKLIDRGGHACSISMADEFNQIVLSYLIAQETGESSQLPSAG